MRSASVSVTGMSCGEAVGAGDPLGNGVVGQREAVLLGMATVGVAEGGATVKLTADDGAAEAGARVDADGEPVHAVAMSNMATVVSALIMERAAKSCDPAALQSPG